MNVCMPRYNFVFSKDRNLIKEAPATIMQPNFVVYEDKNIFWSAGGLPVEEDDWKILEEKKISTIFNFSFWSLKRRPGFEIINFAPNIISLIMPMTDQEKEMAEIFTRILGQAQRSKRLYICGDLEHRYIISSILGYQKGLKIHNGEIKLTLNGLSLLEKYKI